jgi:hypothetical protein
MLTCRRLTQVTGASPPAALRCRTTSSTPDALGCPVPSTRGFDSAWPNAKRQPKNATTQATRNVCVSFESFVIGDGLSM